MFLQGKTYTHIQVLPQVLVLVYLFNTVQS